MTEQINKQDIDVATSFNLPWHLKFAWLIRQDVRAERDIDDVDAQKDFVLWWALHGQKEYPGAEPLPDELKKSLFELLPEYPRQGRIGISRLLLYLYQLRSDVQKLYDLQTLEGVLGFSQWFYLFGLKEHGLAHLLNADIIAALNEPMTGFWHAQPNPELPLLSPLMFFVWSVRQEEMPVTFDLDTCVGREQFLAWFFLHAVADMELDTLLNDYWFNWINDKVSLDSLATPVRRIELLSFVQHQHEPRDVLVAFSLSGVLRFIWLTREDVRAGRAVDDSDAQKDFVVWWVLHGQKESVKQVPLSNELKVVLFELLPDYPQHGRFGVSRLLLHVHKLRGDIQELYDLQTIEGVISFSQWFYLYGLKEHTLTHLLTPDIISALNEPMLDLWSSQDDLNLPELSPLMFFSWFARQDIQEAFDINTLEGRQRFLGWFFLQGVPELGLDALLSKDWLDWLKESVLLSGSLRVKRIGLLYWEFRDDIQNAFDLKNQQGEHGLINWTENALNTDPTLQWLNHDNSLMGVNLIGFAFGELGIGEDVRMAAAACDSVGIPYTVISISPEESVRQNDQILASVITKQVSQLKYQTNIFCLTGFDTVHVYLEKGRQLFENRYNIGWWPWELPVWPEEWLGAFDLMDEIWAATSYTQTMYQQATEKPVTLMPLPVSVERAVSVSREEMGLAKNTFLFLYIFDFNSYLHRKNPQAVVKAFVKAFVAENTQVGLVLKTMNSNADSPKWKAFQRQCTKDKRIVLLEKTLDREKVLGLIDSCDAYISLHRAEGFGRTPAEAMLFGKPVIATDFSGNTDFINARTGFPVKWRKKAVKVGEYPFITEKSNAYWAEPDIAHAAEQMQIVFKSAKHKIDSDKIKQFAMQQFSLSRIGTLMKQRLIKINEDEL